MAVYTVLDKRELAEIVEDYGLVRLNAASGITAGSINTTYLVRTHINDGTTGQLLPPACIDLVCERLCDLAWRASWRADGCYRPIDRIDLVLLGDVLDIMGSRRWLASPARRLDRPGHPRRPRAARARLRAPVRLRRLGRRVSYEVSKEIRKRSRSRCGARTLAMTLAEIAHHDGIAWMRQGTGPEDADSLCEGTNLSDRQVGRCEVAQLVERPRIPHLARRQLGGPPPRPTARSCGRWRITASNACRSAFSYRRTPR